MTDVVQLYDVRGANMHRLSPAVWEYNDDMDLYTRLSKRAVCVWEVDHIVEVQLANEIVQIVASSHQIVTRSRLKKAMDLFNDLSNLNNTSSWLNNMKGKAFKAVLDYREPDLRSALQRYGVNPSHRDGIVEAFVDAAAWITDELDEYADDVSDELYNQVACVLQDWVDKLAS